MKFRIVFFVSVMLSLVTTPLYAESSHEDVLEQLFLHNITNGIEGYDSVVDPLVILLDEADSEVEEIYMHKKRQYMITVVCDDDCDDVDVWLYDMYGQLIDSDTDDSDTATIRGRPKRSGHYKVRIRISNCDKEPCYVGAQAFIKN